MKKIDIIITDDHNLFRKGLRALISDFEFVENINEASNGEELLKLLASKSKLPDVILLDLKMPVMDGITAQAHIKKLYPSINVIIITMEDDEQFILHMIGEGVNGYLLKNAEPEEVETALIKVIKKGFYFPDNISSVIYRNIVKKDRDAVVFNPGYTERELEVLTLICKDFTNTDISEELNISKKTVENYKLKILEKSGAKSMAGLVVNAIKFNWVTLK
jgi:DNA-binding NarL/FixJ family response regulator